MRILTGDECGLLKEVIPELSRPAPSSNNGSGSIHSGNARPSATSIQAAAAAQMQQVSGGGNGGVLSSSTSAVRKIEESEGQSRQRGAISMAFVPPSSSSEVMDDDDTSSFQFATLRMNGVVQLWSGNRSIDNEEGHVTPATYRQVGLCQNVFRDITTSSSTSGRNPSDEENENDVSSSFVDGTNNNSTSSDNTAVTGWNAHQPIRPIAMVSSHRHDTTTTSSSTNNNNNPILACADSMGNISLLNSQNLQKGILTTTYNAFDLSTTQIIQAQHKSNIKHSTSNNAVLTYTKGRYANTAICTALELLGSNGERLAIGGRERGIRVLDVTTGQLLWKAKNLPPDPQTLLQQPQWTTCIQSLTMNGNTQDLLGTGTAYKQVQIYDVRVNSSTSTQRRPVLYTPEGLLTHRITTLCQLHTTNSYTLAIGDSTGDCHLIDTRRMHSGKQYSAHRKQSAKEEIGLGRLVGPGGSIRSLVIHPTLPYLACVGLDRKLWTWDVNKRKMMDCVYLKQRLNCALFCGDDCWSDNDGRDNNGGEDDEGEGGEVEYEELDEEWNNKRERELEEDQDEVEDYIDSDDDEGGDEKQDSGDETASDSEEEEGDDSGGSGSSEEEEEAPSPKRNKRQKR